MFLEYFDAESRQAANSQVAPFQSRKKVVVEVPVSEDAEMTSE